MDLKELSDEELRAHLNEVINEQERRQRLAALPKQMAEMAARFVEDGGDRAELINAVSGTDKQEVTHE